MDVNLCVKCQGKGLCGKPCQILAKFSSSQPKSKIHFSGSSPPEIFIGRHNYPFVNSGILSPEEYGETTKYSLPELWHENNFTIPNILRSRGKLIYSRFKTSVYDKKDTRFLSLIKETALAVKPVSVEVFLKKAPRQDFSLDSRLPIIGNPAPLKSARLEENIKSENKIEYLAGDTDVKSSIALKELYHSTIQVSNIIKVLSAGLLGRKTLRKLVPTRWSVTAVDDTLSKFLLDKIRYYPEISEILVFTSEYLGNHYEFLLLPDKFSFEVIEAKMTGSVWNPTSPLYLAQDYEGFNGRKEYASEVTGAYYSNRLALAEYLDRIKKQASCLVMRECRPEYYAPCGVGILREASRAAFRSTPESFPSIQEAFKSLQTRLRLPTAIFEDKSWLIKEHGKQSRLNRWV